MNSSRVLIFSQHFYPESFRVNEIAVSLIQRGLNVDVLTGMPNYPKGSIFSGYEDSSLKLEIWKSIKIFRVPIFLRRKSSSVQLAINYLSFVLSALVFSPFLLRKNNYTVIFCYATSPFIQVIPAIFLAWIKGSKLIVNVQDLWPESLSATGHVKNKIILKTIRIIVDWIYRKSDVLLVQSMSFKKIIKKRCPSSRVIYWPNSVESFFVAETSPGNKIKDDLIHNFSILFAGNIGWAQSIETIIGAADLLSEYCDIKFFFAGDGSAREFLLDNIKFKKLSNVSWIGSYPSESMPSLFKKASLLLVSLSNQDIFSLTIPNKIQAYLAVGKPIIASLDGEGAQIIKSAEAGMVVPSGDSKALAKAILRMFNMSSSELDLMGKNGRNYFLENFENDKLIDRLIEIFEAKL